MAETLAQQQVEDVLDEAQAFFISMLDTKGLIEYYTENPSPALLACVMESIRGEDTDHRRLIAGSPIPSDILLELTDDESSNVLHTLAVNPWLPLEGLIRLSFHEHEWARAGAALNSELPAEHTRRLARDKAFEVREFIASHKNLPQEDLILLSNDKERFVLRAVAANPRLPMRHLKRLKRSKHASVCDAAEENLSYQLHVANQDDLTARWGG